MTGQNGLYTIAAPVSFADYTLEHKAYEPPQGRKKKITGFLQGAQPRLHGADTYTAVEGDTYASIAKKEFGDEDLASVIALYNGNQTPTMGTVIQLPQIIPGHNGPDNAYPYYQLLSIIEGNLLPYIPKLKPIKQHPNFFKQILSLLTLAIALLLQFPKKLYLGFPWHVYI